MMRLLVALAVLAMSTSASAITISGLYNTGVDATGIATTGNGADLHWSRLGGTAYTGGVNGTFPIGPWIAETTSSRWLTPAPLAGQDFDPSVDGQYTYSLSFSLAGFNPATASFSGRFSVDNFVTSIKLNGTTIAGSGGDFLNWYAFNSTGGVFNAGNNVLTFTVDNGAQASGNPTGLRVEILGSDVSAVPEAATWMTLVAGFGLVGAAARRRRVSSVTA